MRPMNHMQRPYLTHRAHFAKLLGQGRIFTSPHPIPVASSSLLKQLIPNAKNETTLQKDVMRGWRVRNHIPSVPARSAHPPINPVPIDTQSGMHAYFKAKMWSSLQNGDVHTLARKHAYTHTCTHTQNIRIHIRTHVYAYA